MVKLALAIIWVSGTLLLIGVAGLTYSTVRAQSAKFLVGQCISQTEQEEWDHLPVYLIEKTGKQHYLVKDCDLNLEESMSFTSESNYSIAACPKGCKL